MAAHELLKLSSYIGLCGWQKTNDLIGPSLAVHKLCAARDCCGNRHAFTLTKLYVFLRIFGTHQMNHTQLQQQQKTPQEQKPCDPQSARARFTSAEKCSNYLARLVLLPEIERHGFFVCVVALVRTCIHTRVAFVMYPLYTVECTDMYAFVGAALWGGSSGGRGRWKTAGRDGCWFGLVRFWFRSRMHSSVCVWMLCVCVWWLMVLLQ